MTRLNHKTMKVNPCINCGNINVKPYNCGYSSFNCSGITCDSCKREIIVNGSSGDTTEDLIKVWNRENNPKKYLKELENQKKNLIMEINRIKNLFNL